MGTILFVIIRVISFFTPVKLIDTPIDWVLLCFLVAIDSTYVVPRYWKK